MKNMLLYFFLLGLHYAHSQSFERSLSAGYHTQSLLVKPYLDGKWLLAGKGVSEPGAIFKDTLFIAIIDQDGQLLLRKNLVVPESETQEWMDLLTLPDGGILATFLSTYCDGGKYYLSVQKLDDQGDLIWEKNASEDLEITRLPEKWFVAPDGSVIGATLDHVWKLDLNTGTILENPELIGANQGSNFVVAYQHIPDTEDFFALGVPSVQLWHKSGSSTFPKYNLVQTLELPNGMGIELKPGGNGWFYGYNPYERQFERVNYALHHEVVHNIYMPESYLIDFEISGSILYYGLKDSLLRLKKIDIQNQVVETIETLDLRRNLRDISVQNGWMALAGSEFLNKIDTPNWYPTNSAAWVSAISVSSPNNPTSLPDAAVTEIAQSYPMNIEEINSIPLGNLYNIYGGGFKIKVTNVGPIILNRVNLNIEFDRIITPNFICYSIAAKQKQFTNLNLGPGESTWLDFGDVEAQGQAEVPTEICFWTSSPNEQPDAVHENDQFCHPVTYVVAAHELDSDAFSFMPNPADQFADLFFQEDLAGEPWQLFDALGRLMRAGVCPGGNTLRLETEQLPNGFYLFQVKNRVSKLLVQH
jgi:hypothetical protein